MTKNMRQDGIRTLADLHERSTVDDITGCHVIDAPKRKGTHYVWLPAQARPVSLPTALAHLIGKPLQPGQRWVPRCGNTGCVNLEHRFIGTRRDLMLILRPTLDPLHRARIAAGHRERADSLYSADLRAEILASEESGVVLGARLGIHHSHISMIRRGKAWRNAAPTSSVFNLGGSV